MGIISTWVSELNRHYSWQVNHPEEAQASKTPGYHIATGLITGKFIAQRRRRNQRHVGTIARQPKEAKALKICGHRSSIGITAGRLMTPGGRGNHRHLGSIAQKASETSGYRSRQVCYLQESGNLRPHRLAGVVAGSKATANSGGHEASEQ